MSGRLTDKRLAEEHILLGPLEQENVRRELLELRARVATLKAENSRLRGDGAEAVPLLNLPPNVPKKFVP